MEHHLNLVHNIPFFSIFFAMFCGIITPLVKNGRIARYIHGGMVLIVGVMSVILLMNLTENPETFTFMMGHFPAPWGNELRVGPLEAMLAVTFSVVMFLTVTGGSDLIFKDIVPEKQNLYFLMLNALFGAMLAMIYTNDIFTAYVFIEILTISSCALILAKGTKQSMVGTTHYLVFGCLGSGLFLLGVCILYGITGHLLFPQLQDSVALLMENGGYHFALMIVVSLMFVGLGIKSALFPFHQALPTAYGSAIPTSSGVLSGLVLKAYIILAIKLVYEVFSPEILMELKVLNVLFVLGVLGMVMGSLFAMKETRMKRMLAYSSVAQIGYIFMGIGLGTHIGMTAACFHILAHAFTKSMLFVCCGKFVDEAGGKEQLENLKGAGLRNPLAGLGFTVGALSMVGVPLTAGFISKLYFASASVFAPGKMAAVLLVLAISMILNALYFLPSCIAIWTPSREGETFRKPNASPAFSVAIVLFIVANLALGIWYGPIIHVIEMGLSLLR